ncbi:YaaC family protein, partial [Acinetobacter sp. NS-4]|uniref:YaaC family protein n=1 Tax=Acinetobacter sp. NS-4 TaxID=3127956 RepID=UPI00307D3E2F
MGFKEIKYKNKNLTVHKSIKNPNFDSKTVLVTDTWEFVDLWLNRHKKTDARFFWNQAKNFYYATLALPSTSAPLTAYYCFLNASKALLLTKGISFSNFHGVSGYSKQGHTSLSNEIIKFQCGGILPALATYLGEPNIQFDYSLKDILYNLPNIHRAYNHTYSSQAELFIPVFNPKIVKSNTTSEAWLCAELSTNYANNYTYNKLTENFEKELSIEDKAIIRFKRRFSWKSNVKTEKDKSLKRYINTYHPKIRKHIVYINGINRLWYLKRTNVEGYIDRGSITLTFAAMHRLSELARYSPD